jgi:hypothetical protein
VGWGPCLDKAKKFPAPPICPPTIPKGFSKHTRRMPGHGTILYCPPSGTQALGEPLSSHGAPQRWHWPADALRGATLRGACKVAGRAPQEETEHL